MIPLAVIPVDVHALPRWLVEAFHVDPTQIPPGADAWISFQRFPESGWGLLAVLAVLGGFAAIAWIYRREVSLSTARRVVFAALRCVVLLAIALALFGPVLEVSVEEEREAVTLVLIDDSLSFGIADAYRGDAERRRMVAAVAAVPEAKVAELTRAEIVRRLLDDRDARFLDRLAERNRLRVFAFSERAVGVGIAGREGGGDSDGDGDGDGDGNGNGNGSGTTSASPPRVTVPEIPARGAVTDLGLAVRSVVEAQGATRVAAVVLITDGKVTAGEDPAGLGLFLAGRDIPVYAIGVGDPSPTRNIRVMAVFAPERVFLDDPLAVDVRLDHRGFDGESVTVELVRAEVASQNGGGGEEVLGSRDVTFGDTAEATARFEVLMDRPGRFRLIARVASREEETFDTDNERTTPVEVVEQATRVLLIAGAPSNEFRMLRNLLRRDRRVHLAAWLMSADPDAPQEGNEVLEKLPSTPRELFEYDVVILNDADPRGFPLGFADLLERFVGKHRGGLALIAGEKYSARLFSDSDAKSVRDLLPVEPDTAALRDEFGRGRFHTREWPIVPTRDAVGNPATRLSSRPERNSERWAELSGIYWSLPVRKSKPGATVLLEHPDPRLTVNGVRRPLMASQFYEGGRSTFIGFDESWRWRALSQEIYDQFWMQVVRSLTEGRLLGDRRQLILTDRETYDLGDVIRISALVQSEDYEPSTAESIEVEVTTADAEVEQVTLRRDPDQAGWFRGVFQPRGVGDQRIRIPGGADTSVRVEVPDLEFQDPRLDIATLRQLADATGGAVVPLDRFAELPSMIESRPERVVVADEPRPLWDSSVTLGVVVFFLALEWILRKWSRLP